MWLLCCRTFVGLVYTKACLVAGATTEFLWTKKYTSDWAFSLISFFFHRRRRERERERESQCWSNKMAKRGGEHLKAKERSRWNSIKFFSDLPTWVLFFWFSSFYILLVTQGHDIYRFDRQMKWKCVFFCFVCETFFFLANVECWMNGNLISVCLYFL